MNRPNQETGYVFIVVHGVGKQKKCQSLHEFTSGWLKALDGDTSITRAAIAGELEGDESKRPSQPVA